MTLNKKDIIISLGTFPPRQCGIATFSKDLLTAYNHLFLPPAAMKVVAMQSPNEKIKYPKTVLFTINQDETQSYLDAANKINKNPQVKLVSIQHEFGIYGGIKGSYLELFLGAIKKPVVVTFHTVLPSPDPGFINSVRKIVKLSHGIVVMTELSREILITDYRIPKAKITIIPHGIHPQSYISTSSEAKTRLGLPQSLTLTTFGLLSKNKGIEYIIQSLPDVIKVHPSIKYYIIGRTHPTVKKYDGEEYRKKLQQLVRELGLDKHVVFINRYFNANELLQYLEATDIYISGSVDPNQAVSGTLSYALGSGRPVISTSFAQASEIVTPDVGALVPFKDPKAFSRSIIKLLKDKVRLQKMGKNAYFKTRHMVWPNVGLAYAKYFLGFLKDAPHQHRKLPSIKLDHIKNLTDGFGIFQFAHMHIPDTQHGYTLDDNARALQVMTNYYQRFRDPTVLPFIGTYLKFIKTAAIGDGKFHNYFNADKTLNVEADTRDSLEDANARCMFALMTVIGSSRLPDELRKKASRLYHPASGTVFGSPRSAAFYVKGLYALHDKQPNILEEIKQNCDFLVEAYKKYSSDDWQWFETRLTYSNAVLPEALLLGYLMTGKKEYLTIGKKTLDFLISHTFVDGVYVGIGQDGWFESGGEKAEFDQQPEDPAAMVQTLKVMYGINNQERYNELMHIAFNWFLGDNVLGQFVHDTVTGGSYDGISKNRTNLNQGAESSLVYLLARLLM